MARRSTAVGWRRAIMETAVSSIFFCMASICLSDSMVDCASVASSLSSARVALLSAASTSPPISAIDSASRVSSSS